MWLRDCVTEGVAEPLLVCVWVGVAVPDPEPETDAELVALGVPDGEAVPLADADPVPLGVAEPEAVSVTLGLCDGVAAGLAEALWLGVAVWLPLPVPLCVPVALGVWLELGEHTVLTAARRAAGKAAGDTKAQLPATMGDTRSAEALPKDPVGASSSELALLP